MGEAQNKVEEGIGPIMEHPKQGWQTPKLEVFGKLEEMTHGAGGKGTPPKFAGVHDNIPQGEDLEIQCPPGQFGMPGACDGIGGVS